LAVLKPPNCISKKLQHQTPKIEVYINMELQHVKNKSGTARYYQVLYGKEQAQVFFLGIIFVKKRLFLMPFAEDEA